MMDLMILLLFAVTVGLSNGYQPQGYTEVYIQSCPNIDFNITTCLREFPHDSPQYPSIYSDMGIFTLPTTPTLDNDCVQLDSTKQRTAYQCARNVMLTCLPSQWHDFVLPVQSVMDYRTYRCQNMNVISSCHTKDRGIPCPLTANSSADATFKTSNNPLTSLQAFCSVAATTVACVPTMYPKCSQAAHTVIQELYSKLRLPACGASQILLTNWLVLLSVVTVKLVLHS